MLEGLRRSRWRFVTLVAIPEVSATVEEPTTGKKKVMPIRNAWHSSIQTICRRARHEKPDLHSKCMTHVDLANVPHRFAAILN